MSEVAHYHNQLRDERLALKEETDRSRKAQMETNLHVMNEVYGRMQENLRDHGPRRPDSFLERLSRKFIK